LPAATLPFKAVVLAPFKAVVLAGFRAWPGAGSRLPAATFLSCLSCGIIVRTWLGDGFRFVAGGVLFFRDLVPVVPVILVVLAVRDRVVERLTERRSAGDFLVAFAILPP
jgi:hypothetical protein